jgi:muramoyltetrapeptide carboxypeptidase
MPSIQPVPRVKPPALQSGDTVGIVAPASNINRTKLEAGCEALRKLGYKPFYLDSILEQDLYFAGPLERRVRELEEMFERDEVRAIVCARGGYGANYLLEKLDLSKVRAHPKIVVGYSDITTLMTYLNDAVGLISFHGPMVTKDFSEAGGVHLASWQAAVGGTGGFTVGAESSMRALMEGTAEGILYGGCLSMLVASLGTPFEIRTDGIILFVEDVATKPYQIDRMLMQLRLAGKLDNVHGLVFGEMLDCVQTANQGYTLEEVVTRVVKDLAVPVAYGLRSGHVSRENVTLPLGVRAALKVSGQAASLTILEAATKPGVVSASFKA